MLQETVGPPRVASDLIVIAAIQTSAAVIKGELSNKEVDMMLDSGSSISLVQECVIPDLSGVRQFGPKEPQIVSAAGETIPFMGHILLPVKIG